MEDVEEPSVKAIAHATDADQIAARNLLSAGGPLKKPLAITSFWRAGKFGLVALNAGFLLPTRLQIACGVRR
jgi:hypothetical protein